jgi:hypothetical protein
LLEPVGLAANTVYVRLPAWLGASVIEKVAEVDITLELLFLNDSFALDGCRFVKLEPPSVLRMKLKPIKVLVPKFTCVLNAKIKVEEDDTGVSVTL